MLVGIAYPLGDEWPGRRSLLGLLEPGIAGAIFAQRRCVEVLVGQHRWLEGLAVGVEAVLVIGAALDFEEVHDIAPAHAVVDEDQIAAVCVHDVLIDRRRTGDGGVDIALAAEGFEFSAGSRLRLAIHDDVVV